MLFAAPAHAATATQRFDFGTASSPVAEGYTPVRLSTLYTAATGYGLTSRTGVADRDRAGAFDAVARDFLTGALEFKVDVENGEYDVTAFNGDGIASSKTVLTIEGKEQPGINAASGVIAENRYPGISVNDGQLNVVVTGSSPRINGLIVSPALGTPAGLAGTVDFDAEPAAVDLSWDAVDGAAGYRVYRSAGTGEPERLTEQPGTGFRDDTAVLGRSYTYTVTAVADGGAESDPSQPLELTVADPDVAAPATPTGLATTEVNRNDITLGWNPSEGASFYLVSRSTRADGPFAEVASVREPTFTDTKVLTTRPYYYQVTAVGRGGASEPTETLKTEAPTVLVRQAEYLDRAPVAVATEAGVYLGWRMLGLDDESIAFNVYRDGVRITDAPITGSTNHLDADGTPESEYLITAVVGDREMTVAQDVAVWTEQSLDIPVKKPAGGTTPAGEAYEYEANDASVGDLDGDGQYEIVLKWNPTNAKDNSRAGYTGNVYLDAYELDGTQLWRIDLGRNIRAGAHYTQFQVFDYDGDGKAEVAVKTADGTVDGQGTVIGNAGADHRNSGGYVLTGPEYLTVFGGDTGAAVDTVDYVPARGNVGSWGDTYGNRVDRFLAATAYLDGERPSMIFSRGYYTRTVIAAFDFRNGQLEQRWVFDSDEAGDEYAGQGNHNLSPADVDGDGLDEIVFGSMTIDDDGTPLYSTDLGHGDALHVSDHNPGRAGLEVYAVHEDVAGNGGVAASMRDAETGAVLWKVAGNRDTGRGAAADIDPRHAGAEAWSIGGSYAYNSRTGSLRTAGGTELSTSIPAANFVTWWDGDLLREITDHDYTDPTQTASGATPTISKWDWETATSEELLRLEGSLTVNGTKGNSSLQADLLGDWREELLVRSTDGNSLKLFTTTDVTDHRIRTLMHDPVYRLGVAWQNTAYNQPPHTSFFLGEGMQTPAAPRIAYVDAPAEDESAPTISGVAAAQVAAKDKVLVEVTADDPESGVRDLTVAFNGETVQGDDGKYELPVAGLKGTYELSATAVNHAGLSTTVTAEITVRPGNSNGNGNSNGHDKGAEVSG